MIKSIPKHILDLLIVKKPNSYDHPEDYKIGGVKPVSRICEDCGDTVTDRVIEIRKYQVPSPHWRKRCKNCNCYCNPQTGEYDVEAENSRTFFKEHLGKNR